MRYITKIEYSDSGINIILDNGFPYIIKLSTYADEIENNISCWINQLLQKTWIDINSLYEIGSFLSQQKNTIDWIETFIISEEHLTEPNELNEQQIKELVIKRLEDFKFKLT